MKKLLVVIFIFCCSVAQAAELEILNQELKDVDSFYTNAFASFKMDKSTNEGFVNVTVVEERGEFRGGRHTRPYYITVFKDQIKVDGLKLVGDQVVYQTADSEVLCGTMGESRVFHKPTLYLSGKCVLTAKVIGNLFDSKIIVKMIVK